MKKVKIMLLSALVLAAVGGALAFKTRTYGLNLLCGDTQNSCTLTETEIKYELTTGAHFVNVFCTTFQGNTDDCKFVTLEP